MKKKVIILVVLLICLKLTAQTSINPFIYQDGKLLVQGDEIGNEAPTLNILTGLEYTYELGNNVNFVSDMSVEYADLVGGKYVRQSLNIGGEYVMGKFEPSFKIGAGNINRYSKNYLSFGALFEVKFRFYDNFYLSLLSQYTQRTELKEIYRTNDYHRFSLLGGVKYKFKLR